MSSEIMASKSSGTTGEGSGEKGPVLDSADAKYAVDPSELEALRKRTPWMKDAKYFHKVALSPSAVMKIMMHCQSGVDKGISKGGNPIEVMGMLLGRPDPVTPKTLVITDAFPLPIEGFETRVVADDDNVTNHMIALGESLEKTRRERFCGWYHSHPFDLGDHSHCFLSQTDLTTQLQWQRLEDPHGNPFVAIVVDPLRSAHSETPELKAFRAYPPEFSPAANECPDGSIETREKIRLEHWGSCWNRYYELDVEYFMSRVSRNVMERLTQDYLWMRTLTRPTESSRTAALESAAKQYETAAATSANAAMTARATAAASGGSSTATSEAFAQARAEQAMAAMAVGGTSSSSASAPLILPISDKAQELHKAAKEISKVATEQVSDELLQTVKETIFA